MFMLGVNEHKLKCSGCCYIISYCQIEGRWVHYLLLRGVPSGPSDAVQELSNLFFEFSTVIPRTQGNIKVKMF